MAYQLFGLRFNPFFYLDSTRDEKLHEYLVIPKAVESLWDDAPIAILAEPGSGKSALRRYAEKAYRATRGAKLPVTYVPSSYDPHPSFHLHGLKQSLARAVFIYLISYPDIFLNFPAARQEKCIHLLNLLPYDLDFLLGAGQQMRLISDMEQFIGAGAISRIYEMGDSHHNLFARIGEISRTKMAEPKEKTTPDLFLLARDLLEIHSFQILIDGLDGFRETTAPANLLHWLEPLIQLAVDGYNKGIYYKFFLPFQLEKFSAREIKTVSLKWDNGLLADVIRKRLYVASGGAFDTLDAFSLPGIRNADLRLAQRLEESRKRPREIIKSAQKLLEHASAHQDGYIHEEDFCIQEANYAEPSRA